TDVEGVYTADPARHPDARIVERTTSIAALRRLCFAKRDAESTGGMATKLDAAERVQSYGIPTVILGGRVSGALEALFDRHPVGTLIEPAADDAGAALDARRHWIAVQTRVAGALVVDEGALAALERRASLLPSGIVRIEGRFRRGDIVAVKDPSGRERGRGVARFDDWEVERVRGLHTSEARHLLGSGRSAWVVRPDQFVLMNAGEDEA
ncbi:MAG: glutamate 5-kinase, partial [Gemmatimonadetes bacterium]